MLPSVFRKEIVRIGDNYNKPHGHQPSISFEDEAELSKWALCEQAQAVESARNAEEVP
jgi:hypothetical protein